MQRFAGFSMIEVLVTLVVVSIGLLGLAKMQAAAVSNTQVSRVRSLISLQAESLASAMHGNRAYWASGTAPATFSASGTAITDSTNVLTGTKDCTTSTCTSREVAAFDFKKWVANLDTQFPGYTAAGTCSNTAGLPVSCTIKLTWTEKYVAINRSTAASAAAQTSTQSFTLHVEP
jgi:type IV pilus assembly protein PilV